MSTEMAPQAGPIDLLGGRRSKAHDFRWVSTRFHMSLPRTVTAFAGYALATVHLGQLRVGIGGKLLGQVTMACFAGIGAANIKAVLEVMQGRVPRGLVNHEVVDQPAWRTKLARYAAQN